jgi:NADPH-dependent 2,4-dienoyl-CoA reductase/sulfur reductase-like enzyme/ferredoxin
MWVWHTLRIISVSCALLTALLLFVVPDVGLTIFWKFFVPSLPILFFVAPGLWRNICPMAALNQTPRLLKFTKALTIPKWFKEYSYVIGITLFLIIVPTRKVIFNQTGWALGLVVLASLGTAFLMGLTYKGKSGWCSSMCPLLPIQRIYGQSPYVYVRNSHCQPCIGCTKNCYDFNPAVAYLSDLNDDDPAYSSYRKLFVGLFPGLILGFYSVADPKTAQDIPAMYLQIALYALGSLGIFNLLTTVIKVTPHKITTVFGAAALNIYYWFNIPVLTNSIAGLFGATAPDWLIWGLRGLLLALTLVWIGRTYIKESLFLEQANATATPQIKVGSVKALEDHAAASDGLPEVSFIPEGKRCVVATEANILDVAESNNLRIEAGCRMGMCGADPVAIVKGMENLSPISDEERATLERLGYAKNTRMACCARVRGPVSVTLKPEQPSETPSSMIKFEYDQNVKSIVIIGNGVAGVTTADHIRRRHPDCEIHLIGREKHNLYNRMGIARLIYGRSAMQGLYLLPENWYEEHNITNWLNTQVIKINAQEKQISLGTGEVLTYDKLVLAMGSRSMIPAVENFGIPGTFVLREAEDAMAIRSYAQDFAAKRAIVAGGGLLGLEAAYALLKLGLSVSVLERSDKLLSKQLDARGSQLLIEYLEGIGIKIIKKAESDSVTGIADMSRMPERLPDRLKFGGSGQSDNRVTHLVLKDGRRLSCDVYLLAVGITPNLELAREMGLKINRGVVIDDEMRTSLPDVYAAGDLAEFGGQVYGLWPVATEQAQVVAVNTIGGHLKYQGSIPVTALKVVGIELTSIGRFEPQGPEDLVITLEDSAAKHYRKLIINNGKIVGAILLGYPLNTPAVIAAVKKQLDIRPYINDLQAGNWDVLSKITG